MKIVICDDDKVAREHLFTLLQKNLGKNEAVIEQFDSGVALFASDFKLVDIAFLDIEMAGENGISVACKIHQANPKCLIIFVTSYNEYITEAIRNYAFQFLTKPVKEADLAIEMKRAKEEFSKRVSKIVIQTGSTERVIEVSKIMYAESDNKHVRFVLYGGEEYVTRAKLNRFSDYLFDKNFACPHKSFIVNLFYVKEVGGQTVTLDGGETLPLARSKTEEFKRLLNRYLNGVHYV